MKYLIPGKTFLLGEYSALVGGSVIGLATGPGFEVQYSSKDALKSELPFHVQSAAGMKWKKHADVFQNVQIQLEDHFKVGGFGKSTAEYVSVLIPTLKNTKVDFPAIRAEYQNCSRESGAEVSGLDLAIQYFGQVMVYQSETQEFLTRTWPFQEYDFILVSTGQKVKTHEHLQKIDLEKMRHFPQISNPVVDSFLKGNADEFLSGLNAWSEFLFKNELTLPSSHDLAEELRKKTGVVAVKPCGALGADVISVICYKDVSTRIHNEITNRGLKVQATTADLVSGVVEQIKSVNSDQVRGAYVG